MARASIAPPPDPAPKVWKPKVPGIPRLASYGPSGGKRFRPSFWERWPSFKLTSWKPQSWISGAALRRAGEEAGVAESELVWAQQQLERGADLGVKGAGCLPTVGPNAESARTYRHLLSNALARWVQLELVCGPYKKDELPWVSVIGGELFLDASLHSDQGGRGEWLSHCGRLFSPREGRGGCEWAGPTVRQCRHHCGRLPSANRWDGAHP